MSSNQETIFIRQETPKHTQWLSFHIGKQPLKRAEEKGMLLRYENLNYHTSKLLVKAGDRLVYLTQEKKVF